MSLKQVDDQGEKMSKRTLRKPTGLRGLIRGRLVASALLLLSDVGLPCLAAQPHFHASASAPEATHAPSQAFGQFVGLWRFRMEIYNSDGTIRSGVGTWDFHWLVPGKAVQDIWKLSNTGGDAHKPYKEIGTTIRVLDERAHVWHVVWIATMKPSVQEFLATERDDKLELLGRDRDGSLTIWCFSHITPKSFDWTAKSSKDEGQTWRLEQEMWVERAGRNRGKRHRK